MILSFYDLRLRPTGQKLSLLPTTLLVLLVLVAVLATPSEGFTFRFSSNPSQCMGTSVIWTGGTAPYTLLLLPVGFLPQGQEKRVIFEKTVDQGTEMAFNFPFPEDTRFVAVMSDATGFGTGGTSPVITVSSSNTTSCLPTTPSTPQFYLYLSPTTPSQCSPISISWNTPRNPPVTIYGVIPQGQSFRITPPTGSGGLGFDWTCNIRAGTPFFFVAGDGNGSGTGGSTDVSSVGSGTGGGSGCINAASPSSTPDAGVGGVGPLPSGAGGGGGSGGGGGGGGTIIGTGVVTATATATGIGGGQDGGGNGTGDQDGNSGGGGGGGGTGGGTGGGGNTDGSGGGTVHGPLDPTSIASIGNTNTYGPNIPLILGLVFGLLALAVLIILFLLYTKRRKTALARRDNQRARLLAAGDFSATHLPQSDGLGGGGGGVVDMAEVDRNGNGRGRRSPLDLPHPRPAFAARPWAGGSLESLTSNLRSTPFIWPLGSGSGSTTNSPVSPSDRRTPRTTPRTPRDRDRDRDAHDEGGGDIAAVGASTARPVLERGVGSSSGMLRRLRSVRYGGGGGSGLSFGFPFGGGGAAGYKSLGDGEGGEAPGGDETTPSSGLRNTTTNNSSGAGTGHVTTPSGDSNTSEMHKSPLPPSYLAQQHGVQHASQNSHGSNNSRFSSQPGIPSQPTPPLLASNTGTSQDPLSRPGAIPIGPRPLLGARRPSLGREDTGGSVWEVPPTYASLQGRRGLGPQD